MSDKNKKKQVAKITVFITSLFVIFLSVTYAFINMTLTGTRRQVITAGNLQLELNEDNQVALTNAMPMYDDVGMIQEAFRFRLINQTPVNTNYVIKLVDITTGDKLPTNIVKYGLVKDNNSTINLLSTLRNGEIDSGVISGNATIEYSLRLWIDSSVEDNAVISGKSLRYRIDVEMVQSTDHVYRETILNGADPVLSDNLIPVIIADNGEVTRAGLSEEWYNYENQRWANAVVLVDKTQEYNSKDVIPEENIESYFVWIPRYKYKIFDTGEYSSVQTTSDNAEDIIDIVFETKDANINRDLQPQVGDYITHPAFLAFDSNGFWVGKFESGYKNAKNAVEAQQNNGDASNLVVKPNVHAWRNITIGNAFKASYDYLRSDESHMIKNTEWGAVAYLHHSNYGSRMSIRNNNNSVYLTGHAAVSEPTCGYNNGYSIDCNLTGETSNENLPYNTTTGYTATTTNNISGVYDMSGGAHEYVMGYNMNAASNLSEITGNYTDFFTNDNWNKYYDKYFNDSESTETYNKRILGDATGEMGAFFTNETKISGSWYDDYGSFINTAKPWFLRGGRWGHGTGSGIFFFEGQTGAAHTGVSFRIVLAP